MFIEGVSQWFKFGLNSVILLLNTFVFVSEFLFGGGLLFGLPSIILIILISINLILSFFIMKEIFEKKRGYRR